MSRPEHPGVAVVGRVHLGPYESGNVPTTKTLWDMNVESENGKKRVGKSKWRCIGKKKSGHVHPLTHADPSLSID
jgi:hypothetical protein